MKVNVDVRIGKDVELGARGRVSRYIKGATHTYDLAHARECLGILLDGLRERRHWKAAPAGFKFALLERS